MKVLGVLGMLAAAVLAIAALGVFLWSAFLGSIVTEDQTIPFESNALVAYAIAASLALIAVALWKASHRQVAPEGDPEMAAALVFAIVLYGAGAVLVVWIILRATGVVGPVLSKHG